MPAVYALILAGGRGARFWPLSRRALPKPCLDLLGGRTLLQQTLDRLQGLVPAERVLVVTGPDMAPIVAAQLPEIPAENLLIEPSARGTAASVGWGNVEVQRRAGSDAVVIVLPADHAVDHPELLRDALRAAVAAAVQTDALLTLGIQPDRPETGYGYLELGPASGSWEGQGTRAVRRFVEKPDAATALACVESGNYLWNAGIFVFRADALGLALRRHLSRSAAALDAIAADPTRLRELWTQLDATSLDHGIMEHHDHLLVVPCDPGWSDLGSWPEAARRWPESEGGRAIAEAVVAVDATRCAVHAPGKVVALVGVKDLIVVDTGDALLVLDAARAQEVRAVVEALEARGLGRMT